RHCGLHGGDRGDTAGDRLRRVSLPSPRLGQARLALSGWNVADPAAHPGSLRVRPRRDRFRARSRVRPRRARRALDDLHATGVQIYTNVAGRPLDLPEYQPIFDRMAQRDLPIWLHPARPAAVADYAGETRSKYDMWWAFGWPYETSVAMGRLVFSGIFDRHPSLKIITHHMGAMIPFCAGRVGGGLDQLGSRSDDPEDVAA